MAALTNYAKDKVLDKLLRDVGSFPTDWYYALFVTAQDEDEGGTECTDTAYARQPVSFAAAADGSSVTDVLVLFDPFDAEQDIYAVGICDALTAGHVWLYQNLLTPSTFGTDEQARVREGSQYVTAV